MRMIIAVALCVGSTSAGADDRIDNVLAGPLFGIRLGGPPGTRGIVGIEGGVGRGPERLNVGFEYRGETMFGYVELDPWWILGGSVGVGVDSHANILPVLGVWEGFPVLGNLGGCDPSNKQTMATVAAGYRYAGIHELYFTIKVGSSGRLCF